MLTLKNWYVDDWMYAHGNVYGHYRLKDGDSIQTSWIMNVYRLEEEEAGYVLETFSGSLYYLLDKDMKPERKEKTIILLEEEGFSEDLSLKERLKALEEEFGQRRASRNEVLESAYNYAQEQMKNNELYLIVEHGRTKKALHRYQDEIYEVTPQVHVGMFQDSVLLIDSKHGKMDFRYFPNAEMECYCWSGELEKVHIYNLGKRDFYYGRGDEAVLCEKGKVAVVAKQGLDNK